MFVLFKTSPAKKLEKEHKVVLSRAFVAQRNGDIRQYSLLTAEAEALRKKIEKIESAQEA